MIVDVARFDGTPAEFEARTAAFDQRLWAKYKPPYPRMGMLVYRTGPAARPDAVEVTVAVHSEATLEEAVNRPMSDGTWGWAFPVIAEQTKASITAVALASGSQLQLVCIDEAAWAIVQEHWRRLLVELGCTEDQPAQPPAAAPEQQPAQAEAARSAEEDPDSIPRWGTRRDLSTYEVRNIVKRCKAFQKLPGGSIAKFHDQESRKWPEPDDSPKGYSAKTLEAWMKDNRFQ